MALGRHLLVRIGGEHAGEQRAFVGLARNDRGAVGLAALERAGEGVEVQAALGLPALVALEAAGLEDGLDLFVEVDAALGRGDRLRTVGDDLLGEEVVDGVVGREAGGQGGDLHFRRSGEPVGGGLPASRPIFSRGLAERGARGGIHGRKPLLFSRLVERPADVVIDDPRRLLRRKQEPLLRALRGPGRDRLAELRPTTRLGVDDVAHHGLERDAVFAALGLEFAGRVAVARRGEAEVAAEVGELVLRLDRLVVRAGRREGRDGDLLAVDEQRRGAAGAQVQTMLPRRQGHRRVGTQEIGVRSCGAHARVHVLVRDAEEAERRGLIAFRDLER